MDEGSTIDLVVSKGAKKEPEKTRERSSKSSGGSSKKNSSSSSKSKSSKKYSSHIPNLLRNLHYFFVLTRIQTAHTHIPLLVG